MNRYIWAVLIALWAWTFIFGWIEHPKNSAIATAITAVICLAYLWIRKHHKEKS